jgi:mono/diheme cytochrome c family protein
VKQRRVRLLTVAAGAAIVAAVSGCDLQENADVDHGRQQFVEVCGSCHILQEAATTGNIGPDLDAAFADARASGMDQDAIEGVVEAQIENPRQPPGPDPKSDPTYMPPELVTGDDARDVAAYVASVAGVPGIMPPEAPGGPGGQVFANNGCGSCHTFGPAQSQGQVGPNLDEVLAGMSAAQIEQSIVDPQAKIAAGFEGGVMPANYGQEISPTDLKLLVEFLMKGGQGGGNGG